VRVPYARHLGAADHIHPLGRSGRSRGVRRSHSRRSVNLQFILRERDQQPREFCARDCTQTGAL
jgi:hypothetical protein